MSEAKELTVLAVTKMHGGVCTAGIDSSGKWVRPIRRPSERDASHATITDYCLLPVDFFHHGRSHLVNLGITRFHLLDSAPDPPHIEDWVLDTARKPTLIRKLSDPEQSDFLSAHVERDLSALEPGQIKSLALIEPDSFSFEFRRNLTGDDVTVRASFTAGSQRSTDVGCTDLRMRALGRVLLEKSGGERVELTTDDFQRRGKEAVYLAVGLSRPYRDRHWLIVVGVHCVPEIEVEVDYSRL